MRRCIYCLDEKHEDAFNREHVVPQAFGTFGSNTPVLYCVCTECNGALGRELDEKIATDSIEGHDRVGAGLKNAAEYRTLGRRSTLHVKFDENGPLKGALGFHVPNPEGEGLAVTPMPQVGFARAENGPFEWFPIHDLPTKEQLIELGYERGPDVFMQTWGIEIEAARDALEAKGFARGALLRETPPPSGRVLSEIVSQISEREFRAFSKIAFNYLAFVTEPAFVLRAEFNDIRRFIRHGFQPASAPVEVARNPWLVTRDQTGESAPGHYVIIRSIERVVLADVCVLMRLRYRVKLADGGFLLPVSIRAGHAFDVEKHEAWAIPPERLPPFDP